MVEMVLGNIHILLGIREDWPSIQRNLRSIRGFVQQLRRFRPETVRLKQLKFLRQRWRRCQAAFAPKALASINKSCEHLCRWVNLICWRVGEVLWLQDNAHHLYTEEGWARRVQSANPKKDKIDSSTSSPRCDSSNLEVYHHIGSESRSVSPDAERSLPAAHETTAAAP